MAKETENRKPSMGRIVIATFASGGKLISRPALVSLVKTTKGKEKDAKPVPTTDINAHVFMDGARIGDFCGTTFLALKYDPEGKTENSWAWPAIEKSEPAAP